MGKLREMELRERGNERRKWDRGEVPRSVPYEMTDV